MSEKNANPAVIVCFSRRFTACNFSAYTIEKTTGRFTM